MSTNLEVTIVMVEDDAGHATLITKNLRRSGIMNPIVHFDNGRKAMDYFLNQDGLTKESSVQPMLILLDLNLPEFDGLQILERIKSDPRTKAIPVIILTTTDNIQEVEKGYELGCNVYITKPVEYEAFADSIRKLGLFLSVIKIPPNGH